MTGIKVSIVIDVHGSMQCIAAAGEKEEEGKEDLLLVSEL
jgi:hypothetical protein